MKENGFFDKFIEAYDKHASKKTEYRRYVVKPSKAKCIFGFIFSLVFFVIILSLFSFNFTYFIFFFGSLAVVLYYGINLFTKKGIGIVQTFEVPVEEETTGDDEDELIDDEETEEEE